MGVVAALRQGFHGLGVQAEIEDRVEHAGHRDRGARAHGEEQRIAAAAELLARILLEVSDGLGDLFLEPVRKAPVGLHVLDAGLRGDRESAWDPGGAEDVSHLGQVRPLAAEEATHLRRSLVEAEHPLLRRRS